MRGGGHLVGEVPGVDRGRDTVMGQPAHPLLLWALGPGQHTMVGSQFAQDGLMS